MAENWQVVWAVCPFPLAHRMWEFILCVHVRMCLYVCVACTCMYRYPWIGVHMYVLKKR